VGDPLIVAWRAMTVALLDRMAPLVRERLGVSAADFPAGPHARRRQLGGRAADRRGASPGRRPASQHHQRRDGILTMQGVTIVDHPLVQHKLTKMRDRTTSTQTFRALVREMATLLCYEVTRDLPTDMVEVETPIAATRAPVIAGKKLVFAPVLRAGLQMAEGMLDLVPSARLAHVGLYRDPVSLQAVEYYFKTPEDCAQRLVIVVDPMLATGNTAIAAVDRLKEAGRARPALRVPAGGAAGRGGAARGAPDVPVWAAGMDETLNGHGYIVPGLGDAGDGCTGRGEGCGGAGRRKVTTGTRVTWKRGGLLARGSGWASFGRGDSGLHRLKVSGEFLFVSNNMLQVSNGDRGRPFSPSLLVVAVGAVWHIGAQ
jgi:uracil phosphoribosyltransferase